MKSGRDRIVYVGARTTKARQARGNGLNVYRLGTDLGWTHLQLLEMENPSFLAFDRSGKCLYTVHGDSDRVSSFSIDPATGLLTFLNERSTQGRNPVHLSFDPTNGFLVIANHVTSSLAVLPRLSDGSLGDVCDLAAVTGDVGPHRTEQPFPKPHQVEFDPSGRWIAVPDKGTDSVLVFEIDPSNGKLSERRRVQARENSGPRHISFHPAGRFAYVINELDSTVTAYEFDPSEGKLRPFQILSSLSEDYVGNSRGAEIAVTPDGRFLYASNRGSDTIAAFSIDRQGRMAHVGNSPTRGRTPRFFTLMDATLLLAANEDSDSVEAFSVDPSNGALSATGTSLSVGSPVCIVARDAS